MKTPRDELSTALESLRDRPVVLESRDYARRWEKSRARAARWRGVVFGPVGVSAVALLIACAAWLELPPSASRPAQNIIATRVGETRTVTLSDGSRIVLDMGSRLSVAFTTAARDIDLLQGQAHFEVAQDVRRPFRVRTKSAEVVAVGTMFDVAALPARTTVTLIEGRVNVRAISGDPRIEALTPGEQVGIDSEGQLLVRKEVKLDNVTAWQRGNLVIDDAPLPEALATMNRYSMTRIVVRGEALQSRRISGVFRIGDVETEVLVLQRYFGLRETARSTNEIVLER
jgi:transmembrane sensor